jgi:hypothetical protein
MNGLRESACIVENASSEFELFANNIVEDFKIILFSLDR